MRCLLHSALQTIPAARSFVVSLHFSAVGGWKTLLFDSRWIPKQQLPHFHLLLPILWTPDIKLALIQLKNQ